MQFSYRKFRNNTRYNCAIEFPVNYLHRLNCTIVSTENAKVSCVLRDDILKKVFPDLIALSYEDYLKDKSVFIYMLHDFFYWWGVYNQLQKYNSWYKERSDKMIKGLLHCANRRFDEIGMYKTIMLFKFFRVLILQNTKCIFKLDFLLCIAGIILTNFQIRMEKLHFCYMYKNIFGTFLSLMKI